MRGMPTAFAPACGSTVAAGPASPISRPAMATIRRAGNRPTAPSRSGSPAGSAGAGEAIAGEPFQGDPFPLRNDSGGLVVGPVRSEEHTPELQSLMRISYAGFRLKQKNTINE